MPSAPRTAPPNSVAASFTDPAYPALQQLRAEIIAALHQLVTARGWTDLEAAAELHVGRLRISAIKAERANQFTLDLLLGLAVRAGLAPRIALADPRTVVPIRGHAKA
ncbi:helix-turn-helix domain-containing protein [Cupriavidus metallidurans]|nr:helix-turn-helix domain-containing protein [Cupriavidus metallidurans]